MPFFDSANDRDRQDEPREVHAPSIPLCATCRREDARMTGLITRRAVCDRCGRLEAQLSLAEKLKKGAA